MICLRVWVFDLWTCMILALLLILVNLNIVPNSRHWKQEIGGEGAKSKLIILWSSKETQTACQYKIFFKSKEDHWSRNCTFFCLFLYVIFFFFWENNRQRRNKFICPFLYIFFLIGVIQNIIKVE